MTDGVTLEASAGWRVYDPQKAGMFNLLTHLRKGGFGGVGALTSRGYTEELKRAATHQSLTVVLFKHLRN